MNYRFLPPALCFAVVLGQTARGATEDFHPIVELKSSYLLGARSGGKWLTGKRAAPLVEEGTTYRIFSFTSEIGKATGAKPVFGG